jgi:hypothetical protein
MTPQAIAEVSGISTSIVEALRDAQSLVSRGELGEELSALVRHARAMCDRLAATIAEAGDVEDAVRSYAVTLAAGLENMERVMAGHEPS